MYNRKQLITWLLLLLSAVTAHAQATQVVTGTIFDEASKAPLSGVAVSLVSNNKLGAVSDSAGYFRLSGVPLGRQSFRITYIGYEDRYISDIVITAGKEVNLTVSMQEALRKLNEVTVKAKDKTRTNNDMVLVSARSFNVDETKRYAGALGDPSRMASNFAGVVSGNDASNDIIVRGNTPTGMLWQLEGLNIPNPNHYGSLGSTGGPISMLNNNNIDKSDFLTSAFPAQYGNGFSGVFDIKLRNGNKDKNEFVAQMGFNGLEFGAEGPLGKNKQTSYVINYRYSTLGIFQQLGINFGVGSFTPIYQDLNYKVTSRLNKKARLTVFGIAGTSSINFEGKDVDTTKIEMYNGDPFANQKSKYATTITGASYEYQFNEKTSSKLTLGYSTTMENYDEDSISNINSDITLPKFRVRFNTAKASAVWTLMHKIDARNNIQAGITYDRTFFKLMNKEIYDGIREEMYVDQSGDFGLLQSYAQWKHRFNSNLSSVVGVHFQQISINNQAVAEPRASIRYAISRKHAVSMGYGIHNQSQGIYTYQLQTNTPGGVQYTNRDLKFTRSQHLVTTYDWNINRNLRFKAEAYYQYLDKVPVTRRLSSFSALNIGSGFEPLDEDSLVNKGTGYNYGLELTMEKFFDKNYYFLITTSLFQSRYKGSDGVERNTAFNGGYVLNVLAGKEFKAGKNGVLALNLKLCTVGGKYTTPLDEAQSLLQDKAVYQEDKAFSKKQTDYFRMDFRVAYRREYKRSTLEIALDLQNMTNHQNIFYQTYDRRTNKVVNAYQQGFFPIPTIRYTF